MRKTPRYCFWSIATERYLAPMQACIDSARAAGVFSDFNVLTVKPLERCDSFDLMQFQRQDGLFPIFYLKLAMERLNYDYFVWLDADSIFYSPPNDLLLPLSRSALHVPYVKRLVDTEVCRRYREARVASPFFHCNTSFWIVHHDAIDTLYDLTRNYWQSTHTDTFSASLSEVIGFAAHLLIADYNDHLPERYQQTWGDATTLTGPNLTQLKNAPSSRPSIVHLGSGADT